MDYLDDEDDISLVSSGDDTLFSPSFPDDDIFGLGNSDTIANLFPYLVTLRNTGNLLLDDDFLEQNDKSFFSWNPEVVHPSEPSAAPEVINTIVPKKKGRPRQKKGPVKPIKKCESAKLPVMKIKKRKTLTEEEKLMHNYMERERRRGMTVFLEELRTKIPAVMYDKKASQKKIIDEAVSLLEREKPGFLAYLKEKQRFLQLETRRRQLEKELASGPNGFLCVWKERKGMTSHSIFKEVKQQSKENLEDADIDEAIRLLESGPRSPNNSPGYTGSSADSEEYIEVLA